MGKQSAQPRLDELPGSQDKDFWLDAETHTGIKNPTEDEIEKKARNDKDKHYFVRTTGREAQCIHCNWGFELDPGDEIKDGHLYDKEGKLII